MRHYDYAILRLIPDASRGEVVNVGMVVFRDRDVDVRVTPSLTKARALSAWVNPEHLRQLPEAIPPAIVHLPTRELQMFALQGLFQPVTVDEQLGRFIAGNADDYEARVQETLAAYVVPEPRTNRQLSTPTSRLHKDLREWFRRHGLLAASAEAIATHRVVPRYPIAPTAGIYAEFAIKNGVYRITETVDFRVKDLDSRKGNEAAAKAVALIEARAALGKETTRYAIVAARDYSRVQASLNLLGRHAEHVLIRDSAEDMNFYAQVISKAAQVPELAFEDS